jgi:hypothetical protein
MSYDSEVESPARGPLPTDQSYIAYDPTDLEWIVMLMEIAGICLTSKPGDAFSWDALFAEMRSLAGPDPIDETAARLVAASARWLQRLPCGRFCLR